MIDWKHLGGVDIFSDPVLFPQFTKFESCIEHRLCWTCRKAKVCHKFIILVANTKETYKAELTSYHKGLGENGITY